MIGDPFGLVDVARQGPRVDWLCRALRPPANERGGEGRAGINNLEADRRSRFTGNRLPQGNPDRSLHL